MKVDFIGFFVSMQQATVTPDALRQFFVELLLHRRDNRGDGTQNNQTTKQLNNKEPNN